MEPDAVRRQLGVIRRRREEAVRVDAELARHQATLEARLAELKAQAAGNPAGRRDAAQAWLERAYGPVRSAADLVDAIHAWRENIRSVSSLFEDVQVGRDHLRGDPVAALVVVEYGDYQCRECAEAHGLYARVRDWLEDGRLCVAFRHFPLVDAHPLALRAAQAAEAAAAQGRFWEMHDVLMELAADRRTRRRTRVKRPDHTPQLEDAARRAGLDVERFRADIDDPALLERILEDFRGGLASGVNGTPTFYVNGRRADAGAAEDLYAQIADAATSEQPAAPSRPVRGVAGSASRGDSATPE